MRIPIPFIGPQATARSETQNAQITQNLYPEITDGKEKAVLYRIPGIKKAFVMSNNPCRSNGVLFGALAYFVSGGGLYSVDVNKNTNLVGTLSTNSGRVSIVAGQTYIMIVDGANGYTYDGTTFATIADVDFPTNNTPARTVNHVAYKDGFFMVTIEDTGEFNKSGLEDPTAWDGLEFENAEGRPDVLRTLHASDDFLYLFGEYSMEAWYNSGGAAFPFSRAQGGVSSWGIEAPFSISEADNAIFFLGRIKEGGIEVCQTQGVAVQVISTVEISNEINALTTDDAWSFVYMQNAHLFYVLTFPASQKTFVYDITTKLWHSRTTKSLGQWRPNGHVYFAGSHFVGDIASGQFYELDMNTYTDDGDYIKWIRRTTPSDNNYQSITFDEIILDIQGGVGSTQLNPQLMYRYSDDGGRTWSSEIWADMGKQGEYLIKARWTQLGDSYERIHEFSGTDATFICLLNAYAQVRVSEY